MSLAACEKKGPMEKAGENVDRAVEKIEDTLNPKGPAEKAGEKVDKAVKNVKDEAHQAKEKIKDSVK
ncbi:MAG: hypothetical protein PHH87_05685 [Desulfuromonas sp.]|nr:hypothetical protein [Desulfuromonas sp.]